jgi:hypothetical protein
VGRLHLDILTRVAPFAQRWPVSRLSGSV